MNKSPQTETNNHNDLRIFTEHLFGVQLMVGLHIFQIAKRKAKASSKT